MQVGKHLFGVDIGGTFTDIVLASSDGAVRTCKVSSTTADFGDAIIQGMTELIAAAAIDLARSVAWWHGTTIASNTILEGNGARTALITTRGFRDVLEMRGLRIPVLYDSASTRLGLWWRGGCGWRSTRDCGRTAAGRPLDEGSVEQDGRARRPTGRRRSQSSLLTATPIRRTSARRRDRARGACRTACTSSLSSEILPEIREYERTSTAVVNAYIAPTVARYLASLSGRLRAMQVRAPLRIMQSNGGVMAAQAAAEKPAYIIESGPAAGVIAASPWRAASAPRTSFRSTWAAPRRRPR